MVLYDKYTEIFKKLFDDSRFFLASNNNDLLYYSIHYGIENNVKLLLNDGRLDPSNDNNKAIMVACIRGHNSVIRLLMNDSRVDPTARNYEVVKIALKYNKHILNVLLENKDIFNCLQKYHYNSNIAVKFFNDKDSWYKIYAYIKCGNKLKKIYRKLELKWLKPGGFLYNKAKINFTKLSV